MSIDFHFNKRVLDDVAVIPTKRIRNNSNSCAHTEGIDEVDAAHTSSVDEKARHSGRPLTPRQWKKDGREAFQESVVADDYVSY